MIRLSERYLLREVIGTGGTATVYRAQDEVLGIERAVKLLHIGAGEGMVARLRTEARALARVNHPGVLRISDVIHSDGRDFIVMDLCEGGSLQDHLDASGPYPVEVACGLCLQVLSALAAAHALGVIHRDVKPQNVLLGSDGRALLADFGIARMTEDARSTRTNVAMGSMAYMAPEQRLDARDVRVTADVYAAGCTLYALLTGASPMDLFAAPRTSPRWSDVPRQIKPLLQRATRHDPEERQPNVAVLAAELEAALRALRAEPSAPVQVAPARRLSLLTALLVCATGLGVVQALEWAFQSANAPTESRAGAAPVAPSPVAPSPVAPLPADAAPAAAGPTAPAPVGLAPVVPRAPLSPPVAARTDTSAPPTVRAPARSVARTGLGDPSSAVGGTWAGSFAGRTATLVLEGPADALEGTWRVHLDQNTIATPVRGRYVDGALILEDSEDTPDAGRYTARLTSDGALDGRFEARSSGRAVSFRMRATGVASP